MKKILLSIILALVFMFSSCSCSGEKVLSFNTSSLGNGFNKTYAVSLGEYAGSPNKIAKDQTDVYGEITIKGTYSVSVKPCSFTELKDIVNENFTKTFKNVYPYKLTSNLDITTVYKKYSDKEYKDYITTTSYFVGTNSLTPLYTKVESKTSYIGVENGKLFVDEIKTEDETVFNEDKYTLTRKASLVNSDKTDKQEDTFDYDINTVIDNGYLLLALENLPLKKDKSEVIQVIGPSYGKAKPISVTCSDNLSSLKVNNTDYSDVYQEYFQLQNTSSNCLGGDVGKAQIVYIAKKENKNTIIKYYTSLTSHDINYACLGALVFELTSFETISD